MDTVVTIISKLIDRISDYHFLNNIIPGALFCVVLPYVSHYNLMGENVWYNLVVLYISGICISRLGSVVIEWLYKKIHIINFESHDRYAKAAAKAPFIKTLSMENNMYRTLIAVFVSLLLAKLSDWIGSVCVIWSENFQWILCLLLLVLFSLAYSKQTKYVVKHIKEQLEENGEIVDAK
jgi:hypothetical protein